LCAYRWRRHLSKMDVIIFDWFDSGTLYISVLSIFIP
jgi:hypothetical protein